MRRAPRFQQHDRSSPQIATQLTASAAAFQSMAIEFSSDHPATMSTVLSMQVA
jgi:hypothetical protein